ncbi:class I SAM-dependent methyltransferase [Glycomyces buryatensis]|uniref:Class I SAM-dependent methyltransferase n=1 Tax=Glycomyces buryatensis TaxID=2570927 RepID=A0A4S8PVV4_9ACTN|nr:class I SAM-dependent methyltransferase [Glycomyces buryatensis]THV34631.1 class I SAM-dependent methyltransferase [Glycomyces buryatensis]
MKANAWEWDETLFSGSAAHYGIGRMPYPSSLAATVCDALDLDGSGRLLDVGCGPGSLTMLLAPLFASTVGVDADGGMIAEAQSRADEAGLTDIEWRHLRGEDLPADLGTFRVASFAQSFHWMDQSLVARRVRGMLEPDGAWVHVGGTTHRGADGEHRPGHPGPPWDRIEDLVARYLGPVRRAGQGFLPNGTRGGEAAIMRQAGFNDPTRIAIDEGRTVDRGLDEIVSAVFSLSSSAPHLFGDRLPEFEADLRRLLREAAPNGRFTERTDTIEVVIWRP